MLHGLEWLIPVLLIIVWIVSSLIQGGEKDRSRLNRPRSLPGERPLGERGSRRPSVEIDRFLEEVKRQRRQAAEQRPVSTSRDRPPVATVGPAAPTARPRVPTRPTSGRPAVPVQRTGSLSGRIPEAIPVAETAAAAEVLAVASVMRTTPAPSFPSAETAPPGGGTSGTAEPAAAALPPLAELLRTPDNLRTAVILHEIFGPPRCRRSALG